MNFLNYINTDFPFIVEVGCNDGTDTAKLLEEFPEAAICCFEPDVEAIKKFNERNFDPLKVTLCPMAISDSVSFQNFYVADNTLSGSLNKPKEHLTVYPDVHFTRTISIPTVTLDAMFPYTTGIDLLWMDCQGAETKVFSGAKRTLKKVKFIYTEFSNVELYEGAPNKQQILDMLPDFELVSIPWEWEADGNMFLRRKSNV